MALSLRVQVGSLEYSEKLDLAELEALEVSAKGNEALRAAVAVVFEVPEFGETKRVPLVEFLKGVETVLREGEAALRAPVYYVYGSPMPGLIPPGSASGIVFMKGGRHCCIMGGANECTLTTSLQDEQGVWQPVSVEDVRHLKVIKSDDQGDIEVRKRKRASSTIRLLHRLREALQRCPAGSEVDVTLG